MDDIKIRVIDSKKLIEAINTGSYEINLSAVMALGAVVTQSASQLYDVELTYSADGMTTGHVHITKEQYEFLKWVADPNNWKNLEKEPYSGDLLAYCDELENSK